MDSDRYFIVVPDMVTNGLSSSPSNCAPPFDGINFPLVTPFDNVVAQRRLLVEHFDITGVELAMGFSMSGQQAYHWGALYPEFVKRICSICGSARTSPHNWVYLNAYKTAIESAEGWDEGAVETWPPRLLPVMASIAATMVWLQDWYREGSYREAGADTSAGFVAAGLVTSSLTPLYGNCWKLKDRFWPVAAFGGLARRRCRHTSRARWCCTSRRSRRWR